LGILDKRFRLEDWELNIINGRLMIADLLYGMENSRLDREDRK